MYLSDKLFLIALYLVFEQASVFNSAVEVISQNMINYEDLKRKIKKLLQDIAKQQEHFAYSVPIAYSKNSSHQKEIFDISFRKKIKCLTNERYIVLEEFEANKEQYARILHLDCSLDSVYTKKEFLDKKTRCPYCLKEMTEWMLEGMIDEKGEGRYRMTKGNQLVYTAQYFIEDMENQNLYSLSKSEILECVESNNWSILNAEHQIPEYWESLGVPYHLVFKEDLNIVYAENIRQAVQYYCAEDVFDRISMIKYLIAHKMLLIETLMQTQRVDFKKLTEVYKESVICSKLTKG